jgi:monoamine oxidase
VTSWANDPHSGGAYTHIPPEATPADADLLGEPIGGRLLFAGEHTQSTRMAYADGAMTSGIREAKRLLGQRSVRLGPGSFLRNHSEDPRDVHLPDERQRQ